MVDSQEKLSNNNIDDVSPLTIDQADLINDALQQTSIPSHSYPVTILLFWGIVTTTFVANLFISCIWHVPMHLQASRKMNIIDKFIKNKEYAQALELYEELCSEYPQSYARKYGIEIAKVCFLCSQYDNRFFKKGIVYLQDKTLNEEQFSKLHQIVPWQLKEKYTTLFNVLCHEKNEVKEYQFILNDDKVKLL